MGWNTVVWQQRSRAQKAQFSLERRQAPSASTTTRPHTQVFMSMAVQSMLLLAKALRQTNPGSGCKMHVDRLFVNTTEFLDFFRQRTVSSSTSEALRLGTSGVDHRQFTQSVCGHRLSVPPPARGDDLSVPPPARGDDSTTYVTAAQQTKKFYVFGGAICLCCLSFSVCMDIIPPSMGIQVPEHGHKCRMIYKHTLYRVIGMATSAPAWEATRAHSCSL